MTVHTYTTPQRNDAELAYEINGDMLVINGQGYDLSGPGPFVIDSPFVLCAFRLGDDVHVRMVVPYGAGEEPAPHEEMPEPPPPSAPITPLQPRLFATAGLNISGGVATSIELAAEIASAYYEDGWLSVAFSSPLDSTNYLVFERTDVPAKVEQFKDLGSFELIFSDPVTGDPVEPGRIDLQLLKVTG